MEKSLIEKINKYSKKLKAINLLGGKCELCGEDNYYKLCFHHKDKNEKENNINKLIHGYRWSIFIKEIQKCQLLCHNCHQETHNKDLEDSTVKKNKKIFLEYKGLYKCEKCGYDKCNESLDFHHINEKNKIFRIGIIRKNILEVKDEIEKELDKCIILCKNCHLDLHHNDGFLEKYKKEIKEKLNNMKEKQSKINRDEVMKLFNEGYTQSEIRRQLNTSKGTMSGIFKELNLYQKSY